MLHAEECMALIASEYVVTADKPVWLYAIGMMNVFIVCVCFVGYEVRKEVHKEKVIQNYCLSGNLGLPHCCGNI